MWPGLRSFAVDIDTDIIHINTYNHTMTAGRALTEHSHGRARCPNHDYHSRCIYHIVLNKARGISDYSQVVGSPGSTVQPPDVRLSPVGHCIGEAIGMVAVTFANVEVLRHCIMPDHVHIVLFITAYTDYHLGRLIAALKRDAAARLAAKTGTDPELRLFVPDYNDTILTGKGQLQPMIKYVADNPRRWLLRRMYPEFNRRFRIGVGDRTYEAYGNWMLLSHPCLTVVRYTSRIPEAELHRNRDRWRYEALNGGVMVSPFIHPFERAERDWGMEQGVKLVMIVAGQMPERFKPAGRLFDLCAAGRLLMVFSPMPSRPGTEPLRYTQFSEVRVTRDQCMSMNNLARTLADRGCTFTSWHG